jgi:hypothetical protein
MVVKRRQGEEQIKKVIETIETKKVKRKNTEQRKEELLENYKKVHKKDKL